MRRRFIKPILVSLFWILGCGYLQADPLPGSASLITSTEEIRADAQGVRIRVQALPLGTVLEQVTSQSGVRFLVPESLAENSITARIVAYDWKDAVQMLLTDFSRVEIWNEDLNKSWIRLFEGEEFHPLKPGKLPGSQLGREGERFKSQEVLKTAEMKPQPAWRCFSLTGPPKC